jgi:hypothetical protein
LSLDELRRRLEVTLAGLNQQEPARHLETSP